MSDDQLISINVWLGGRSYRIRIKPDDEEAVHKAVKLADERVAEMRAQYAGKDDQDFISMVLLTYAANAAVDIFQNPFLNDEMNKIIKKIESTLEE